MNQLDWTDPKAKITEHFTVGDLCMLHKWNRLATEADGLNTVLIVKLANKLEEIRHILGPMDIHCGFRSVNYNKLIGAPGLDAHYQCVAADFDCLPHLSCDEVKERLLPHLEALGIRMEDNGEGANWVHIDTHPVIHQRYFKP